MTSKKISRRQFVQLSAAAAGAWLLGACRETTNTSVIQELPTSTAPSTALPPTPTNIPSPTVTLPPAATATATSTATPAAPPARAAVAVERLSDYSPARLKTTLAGMLDQAGGLSLRGARVGIKPNLTGGAWWDAPDKPHAVEYFATHPAVVQALAELMLDAGASQVSIVEGLGDGRIYDLWGYTDIARPLNASLVDLCKPDPYSGYARTPVPEKAEIYEHFYLNGLLNELDVFVSVGKMKCHATTGVTLSLKNLFGIAPISEYRNDPAHNHRSAFHGLSAYDERVPRVILDLNRARPVHLAVVDGVMTAEAGAGPWDSMIAQVKPGLLVLGRDPVAVDAVSTTLMGFDPATPGGGWPFLHGDNHIALAHQSGLGWGLMTDLDLGGKNLAEYIFPFKAVA